MKIVLAVVVAGVVLVAGTAWLTIILTSARSSSTQPAVELASTAAPASTVVVSEPAIVDSGSIDDAGSGAATGDITAPDAAGENGATAQRHSAATG